MHARRLGWAVVVAAVAGGAFGLGLATGSAEAENGYGSEPACYRVAHDVHYPLEENCRPGHELVFLATGQNGSGSLPACIKPTDAYFRPFGESCPSGYEFVWLYTTTFGGVETCTQPNRTYHAPKEHGTCRPGRELVRLQTSGDPGSDDG